METQTRSLTGKTKRRRSNGSGTSPGYPSGGVATSAGRRRAARNRGGARPGPSSPQRAGPKDCPATVRPAAEVASASMAVCDVAGGGDTTPSQPPPRRRAMGQIRLG
uniref:Uncharacterized protein n=1 Tax=Zea mays TaxID=4577 RepID=C0P8U9_MAIZE|nr:unknown [Zea mays]